MRVGKHRGATRISPSVRSGTPPRGEGGSTAVGGLRLMPTVFRWNIARREQLGRLPTGEPDFGYSSLERVLPEIRRCSARVLAMAGDSRLVFIGRSPESL